LTSGRFADAPPNAVVTAAQFGVRTRKRSVAAAQEEGIPLHLIWDVKRGPPLRGYASGRSEPSARWPVELAWLPTSTSRLNCISETGVLFAISKTPSPLLASRRLGLESTSAMKFCMRLNARRPKNKRTRRPTHFSAGLRSSKSSNSCAGIARSGCKNRLRDQVSPLSKHSDLKLLNFAEPRVITLVVSPSTAVLQRLTCLQSTRAIPNRNEGVGLYAADQLSEYSRSANPSDAHSSSGCRRFLSRAVR
jgi:hypothetical protein